MILHPLPPGSVFLPSRTHWVMDWAVSSCQVTKTSLKHFTWSLQWTSEVQEQQEVTGSTYQSMSILNRFKLTIKRSTKKYWKFPKWINTENHSTRLFHIGSGQTPLSHKHLPIWLLTIYWMRQFCWATTFLSRNDFNTFKESCTQCSHWHFLIRQSNKWASKTQFSLKLYSE